MIALVSEMRNSSKARCPSLKEGTQGTSREFLSSLSGFHNLLLCSLSGFQSHPMLSCSFVQHPCERREGMWKVVHNFIPIPTWLALCPRKSCKTPEIHYHVSWLGTHFFLPVLSPPTTSFRSVRNVTQKKGCVQYKRKVDTVKKNIQSKDVG